MSFLFFALFFVVVVVLFCFWNFFYSAFCFLGVLSEFVIETSTMKHFSFVILFYWPSEHLAMTEFARVRQAMPSGTRCLLVPETNGSLSISLFSH